MRLKHMIILSTSILLIGIPILIVFINQSMKYPPVLYGITMAEAQETAKASGDGLSLRRGTLLDWISLLRMEQIKALG